MRAPGVCLVGSTRFRVPLPLESRAKFAVLAGVVPIEVIAFNTRRQLTRVRDQALFTLLPLYRSQKLRRLVFLAGSLLAVLDAVWRRRCRVVMVQSPQEGTAAAAAVAVSRLLGRRVALVVEGHGDFRRLDGDYAHGGGNRVSRWAGRWAAGFTLGRADVLRAVSRATAGLMAGAAPGKPVVQFPPWTELTPFLSAGAPAARASTAVILFAGTLAPVKGLDVLLEAVAQVVSAGVDLRVEVCGEAIEPGYREWLEREVRRLRIEERVAFLGFLSPGELAVRMGQARALVLPSRSEGLGRVILEAGAAGVPVIASNVGGVPELVEEGRTGFLVPPGNVAALAERLAWVLARPVQAAAMGERARQGVLAMGLRERHEAGFRELLAVAVGSASGEGPP